MSAIHSFTIFGRPVPQGSNKAFVVGGKARITSANPKMRPFRNEVARTVIAELAAAGIELPLAGKHVPVVMTMNFYFAKPGSVSKKRKAMVVKPDLDKNVRAATDALTGVLYHDDAQIVEYRVRKDYGTPERVEISIAVQE